MVNWKLTATTLSQLRCTDIPEHATREWKIYCCCLIDVYSRKIIGWANDMRQTTSLVLSALDTAVEARDPSKTVVHSGHGTWFASLAPTTRIRNVGLVGPTGTLGHGRDNATFEPF